MASYQTIKDWPEEDRPREKLLAKGAQSLSETELLAIILRNGNASTGESAIDHARRGQPLRSAEDVYHHFRDNLGAEKRELFYVVLLNNKNRKIRDVKISEGSLTASLVHPREVYNPVIRESAAAVIFVHNHPSGDPAPSPEDIDITRRLKEVGDVMGVRVLDHVVIGRDRFFSFNDKGML